MTEENYNPNQTISPGGINYLTDTTDQSPTENTTNRPVNNSTIIATFLGILILVGGLAAGIVLTLQPQLLQSDAAYTDYASCGSDVGSFSCNSLRGSASCSGSGAGYYTCSYSGPYDSCDPAPGTNQCLYAQGDTKCVGACPGTMPEGYARCGCNNGVYIIGALPPGGSCDELCRCTGNYCPTCTPPPTPPPTRTPTPTPTRTPTPTPTTASLTCPNWGISELSHQQTSHIVRINSALTDLRLIKTHSAATTGAYELEAMVFNSVTRKLYVVSSATYKIYQVNISTTDSIPDGTLTVVATLNPQVNVTGLSYRKSDNSLWAWSKRHGLYKLDIATGNMTLVFASTLPAVEGISWDNNSQYLYLTRSPSSDVHELYRFNPSNNSLVKHSNLPEDTDDMGFAPPGYLGGNLLGSYVTSGGVTFYTYDVITKTVKNRYFINTPYGNIDALAVCVR